MYHAGVNAAYAWGSVYRDYPQAQLQQVPSRRLLPVGDDPVAFPPIGPAWFLQVQHAAALFATDLAVYAVGRLTKMVDSDPVKFPALGQWQPHSYDLPDPMPSIYRELWEFTHVPVRPGPVRFPIPDVTSALFATENWVLQVKPSFSAVSGSPVKFPSLGQWQPHMYDVPDPTYSIFMQMDDLYNRRFSGPAVTFPLLGQWQPKTMDSWDPTAIYTQFRLRLMPLPAPPPIVGPWFVALSLSPALLAQDQAIYQVAPSRSAASDAPIGFPKLGQWTPTTQPLDTRFFLQQLPAPKEQTLVVPSWLAEQQSFAAIMASEKQTFMITPSVSSIGNDAIPFPKLGQWQLTTPPLDTVFYRQLLRGAFERVTRSVTDVEVQNWAALNSTEQPLYLVRPSYTNPSGDPISFPKLGQWMPTAQPLDTPFYRQPRNSITNDILPVPPWISEGVHWAAIGGSQEQILLVQEPFSAIGSDPIVFPLLGQWVPTTRPLDLLFYRQPRNPITTDILPKPPWESEHRQFPALNWTDEATFVVVRPTSAPREEVLLIPAWKSELQNLAAITASQEATYLVKNLKKKSFGHLAVYDAGSGLWRSSKGIWVYDAGAATWRPADNLWFFDIISGIWILSTE